MSGDVIERAEAALVAMPFPGLTAVVRELIAELNAARDRLEVFEWATIR